ncbi:RICIN domain-containing protein [Runella sp.]|uniref:RICIN domain-containing protein n=1 Tax=Runella sp. TaxID=1960881 RepID=UPI003D121F5A
MKSHLKFLIQILLYAHVFFSVSAQKEDDFQKQIDDYVNKLDVSGLKNSVLINKGFFSVDELDYYRKPIRNSKGQIIASFSADQWLGFYERLSMADLRKGSDKMPNSSTLVNTDIQNQSKNNSIPIGIINIDATYLNQEQLDENAKAKKDGKKISSDKYENLYIVAASVLQEDIYQADVNFRISPSLHISNNKNEIKKLEIDFQDGKGFRSFDLKDQIIPYHFSSIGERSLSIRLYTARSTYLFYTRVNVRQLERPQIFREFTITAKPVREDTITPNSRLKNGRTSVSVPRGNVRVILGCDNYFDKPIIVAEGFDLGNDVGLDEIQAYYTRVLRAYTNRGYDLVLLDYDDGRDFIENNAEVLKNLIMQVNAEKQGNEKLIVIGESMSGLIGRWALRKMENDNINHNVKIFISSDSPHQGANIPVSIIQLFRSANPAFITNVVLRFFPKLSSLYSALNTPAATQLLMHYGYPGFVVGVGQPHPEFDHLRNRLQQMGNNGYPQNTENNVAIINGSMNASDRDIFNNFNYGSNLMAVRLLLPIIPAVQLAYIDAYTNQINNNSRILSFWANGTLFWGASLIYYGSSFNDDFLPGGESTKPIPRRLFNYNGPSFSFCFVPTFSSIDYQGARATQNDRELLNVNTAQTLGLTRFSAVYGLGVNTPHTDSPREVWENLGIGENLLTSPSTCPVVPPPSPYFSQGSTPCLQDPGTDPGSVLVNISMLSPTQGQYLHSWSVQPTGHFASGSGDSFNFSANEPGEYTVTCTRSYLNRPDLTSSNTLIVTIYPCSIGNNSSNNCGFIAGDFVYVLNNGQNVYARFHNGTLYAEADNGGNWQFVSKSTLISNGLMEVFANCFAEIDPRGGGNNLPFQNGCYTMKSKLSNKMMQMDNDGNGARIRQYNANGQNSQIFKLEAVDGDSYKIMAATSNRSIESPNGGTSYGTELQLWDYNGSNYQKWQFANMNDGSYRLNPKHSNQMVMDVSNNNNDDGNLIHLWGIHNGDNQRFIFQSTGCPNACNPPLPPNLSANPSTISPGGTSGLTSSNCAGTVNWSNGATGASTNVSPSQTTTYYATCTVNNCQSSSAGVTVNVDNGPGGNLICSAESIECSGNQYEVRNYTVNVPTTGTYTLKIYCRSHESAGTIRWAISGSNTVQTVGIGQTGPNQYVEVQVQNVSLNAGNNTFNLSSGSAYLCFQKVCIQSGNSCTAPSAPSISPTSGTVCASSNQTVTLNAYNCTGTVTWSTNATGSSLVVSTPGNYTATCTVDNCVSGNSNTSTILQANECGGSGNSSCSAESIECSGNQYEVRNYSVTVSNAGTYTIKVYYRSHEGPGIIRRTVNNNSGTLHSEPVALSSGYTEVTVGTAYLNAGTNTVNLSSGQAYLCFQKVCVQSGARISFEADKVVVPNEQEDRLTIKLFPNPADGKVTVRYYLEIGQKAQLEFLNLNGSVITGKSLNGNGSWQENQTDLSSQPNGEYLLKFNNGRNIISRKFTIIK